MKRFIMTFLVASLMITSALSLSSCKKKDTDASTKEWIPVVCNIIDNDSPLVRSGAECPYCSNPIAQCPDDPQWIDRAFYCPAHSHVHVFEATDNCLIPSFPSCRYHGVRKHYHILTWTTDSWNWHGTHSGGGGSYEP